MKAKTKLMRAADIAKEVSQSMKINDVFNLMKTSKPLMKIPKVKKADGRVFFKMRPRDIKTIARLWQKTQELKNYLSAREMAAWLIKKRCPTCPDDLTKLARKGVIPAKRIGRFWAFFPEHRETILSKITSRQASQA